MFYVLRLTDLTKATKFISAISNKQFPEFGQVYQIDYDWNQLHYTIEDSYVKQIFWTCFVQIVWHSAGIIVSILFCIGIIFEKDVYLLAWISWSCMHMTLFILNLFITLVVWEIQSFNYVSIINYATFPITVFFIVQGVFMYQHISSQSKPYRQCRRMTQFSLSGPYFVKNSQSQMQDPDSDMCDMQERDNRLPSPASAHSL